MVVVVVVVVVMEVVRVVVVVVIILVAIAVREPRTTSRHRSVLATCEDRESAAVSAHTTKWMRGWVGHGEWGGGGEGMRQGYETRG